MGKIAIEIVCRKRQTGAELFIVDAKRCGFHPVRGDMFIAHRTENLRRGSERRNSTWQIPI